MTVAISDNPPLTDAEFIAGFHAIGAIIIGIPSIC
jgi:hypothetical protein